MINILKKVAMACGIFSVLFMTPIEENISNPLMWVAIVCIGVLYIFQGDVKLPLTKSEKKRQPQKI